MKRWVLMFGFVLLGTILAADFGLLGRVRSLHAFPLADKVGHFVLFGLMSFLVVRAALQSPRRRGTASIATICSLLLLTVAGLEEWSQLYIAGRTFSALDYAASAAGIIAFGLGAAIWPPSAAKA